MAYTKKRWQYDSYVDATGDRTGWTETPHVDSFQGVNLSNTPQANWSSRSVLNKYRVTIPSFFIDANQLTLPETTQLDKWYVETARPGKRGIKRTHYLYPGFFIDPNAITQPENVQFDKFAPQIPSKIYAVKKQQYTYPTNFIDTKQLTLGESIFIDKWIGYQPSKINAIKRLQYLYPTFFTDNSAEASEEEFFVSEITNQKNPIGVKPNRYTYPYSFIDANALTQPENPQVDKWFYEIAKPRWSVKKNQYLYPTFAFYPFPLPGAEDITLDKWYSETSRPKRDIIKLQYLHYDFADAEPINVSSRNRVFAAMIG